VTAQPIEPTPDLGTGSYEVIHRGDQASVVLPMDDYRRLRALEQIATEEELQDAKDAAAIEAWKEREAAGLNTYVPAEEAYRRMGLTT
jgi:predicted ABC-class ATPase